MQVLLAEEYGFCFGVERAVEMVEGALSEGATVRTRGPLIHNTQEIHRLEAGGVRTIDAPADVSAGETAVIRAHGVTPQVQRELEARAERVIDATCPFVTKVQKLAERAKADSEPQVVNTICSATRDRQDAARALAGEVDAFYVIGGKHSSNSLKLLSVCKEQCERSFLIETPEEINPADLADAERVGVTAGASTPNWLIEQVVTRLKEIGEKQVDSR